MKSAKNLIPTQLSFNLCVGAIPRLRFGMTSFCFVPIAARFIIKPVGANCVRPLKNTANQYSVILNEVKNLCAVNMTQRFVSLYFTYKIITGRPGGRPLRNNHLICHINSSICFHFYIIPFQHTKQSLQTGLQGLKLFYSVP